MGAECGLQTKSQFDFSRVLEEFRSHQFIIRAVFLSNIPIICEMAKRVPRLSQYSVFLVAVIRPCQQCCVRIEPAVCRVYQESEYPLNLAHWTGPVVILSTSPLYVAEGQMGATKNPLRRTGERVAREARRERWRRAMPAC